jgi:hypothetical protein
MAPAVVHFFGIYEESKCKCVSGKSQESDTRTYTQNFVAMSLGPIDWKGLFEWSTKYHDGTRPSADVKPMSEADRKW